MNYTTEVAESQAHSGSNGNGPSPLDRVLASVPGLKRSGDGFKGRCLAHDDTEASLSISEGDDGRVLVKCFAGCTFEQIATGLGLSSADFFPSKSNNGQYATMRKVSLADLATHKKLPLEFLRSLGVEDLSSGGIGIGYKDANGKIVHRKVRTSLVAKEGSRWPKGKPLMLYGEETRAEARQKGYAHLGEGETDRWTLLYYGEPVFGVPGADATKVLKAEHLIGLDRVYIWREPDKGGTTFVKGIAGRIEALGWKGEAFVISIPGVKDASELHLMYGSQGTFREVLAKEMAAARPLSEVVAELRAVEDTPNTAGSRPKIDASQTDLPLITEECWGAIRRVNDAAPCLFQHSGIPVRLTLSDNGAPVLQEITVDRLRHELAAAATFYTPGEEWGEKSAKPPNDVVKNMLAGRNIPLPSLVRLVEAPVFAWDGTLQTSPGYHSASRTYYLPSQGFALPDLSDKPTDEEIQKAKAYIVDDLLGDFPLVGDADRAHAIAALLLPFARDMIHGPTPGHLFEAPSPGSGKGLLADVITRPSSGRGVGIVTAARDDEEWRKRITTVLGEGHGVILIDNIVRPLDSGVLSAALTAVHWTDRLLGKNESVSLPVRCLWLATGNNIILSTELARRFVRIRLDSFEDRPWLREGFKHPELRTWADAHRGDLVWAALTLILAWLTRGRPHFSGKRLGSYEQWSAVVGGILETSGIPGFLTNLDEFYETADLEGAVWRQFVALWWEKFKTTEVLAKDLMPLAVEVEGMDLGNNGKPRAMQTAFGMKLTRQRDRVIGDYRITCTGTQGNAKRWQLKSTKDLFNA